MDPLTAMEIQQFVTDGFVRLDHAFGPAVAAEAARVLCRQAGVDPEEATTWREPVVRVPGSGDPAVVAAINTPRLHGALDQLLGVGSWEPRTSGYGTFPIRFPSPLDPGDTGWHIDGSFGRAPLYRVNLASRGRALLLLMLFTDVGPADAPTRIRVGSHLDVARSLSTVDGARTEEGITYFPLDMAPAALDRPEVTAIGPAGTVYLCHPFLVHAASWPHTGTGPRVLAQPCIHHREGPEQGGFDYGAPPDTPVKRAVSLALGRAGGSAVG